MGQAIIACLLTRIPYGNELKVEDFEKIENAEKHMISIGFRSVRVRCHGDLARVEVARHDRSKLFNIETLLEFIYKKEIKDIDLELTPRSIMYYDKRNILL